MEEDSSTLTLTEKTDVINLFNELRLTWAELIIRNEDVHLFDFQSPIFFYTYYLYYSNDNVVINAVLQSFMTMFSCFAAKLEQFFERRSSPQSLNIFELNNANNEFSIFYDDTYRLFARLNVFGCIVNHANNQHAAIRLLIRRFVRMFCEHFSARLLLLNILELLDHLILQSDVYCDADQPQVEHMIHCLINTLEISKADIISCVDASHDDNHHELASYIVEIENMIETRRLKFLSDSAISLLSEIVRCYSIPIENDITLQQEDDFSLQSPHHSATPNFVLIL